MVRVGKRLPAKEKPIAQRRKGDGYERERFPGQGP